MDIHDLLQKKSSIILFFLFPDKESVERRLYNLHEQGYIQVNVSDSVCSTST